MLEGALVRSCGGCGRSQDVRDWFGTDRIEGVGGYERRVRIYSCLDCFRKLPEVERRTYRLRETF